MFWLPLPKRKRQRQWRRRRDIGLLFQADRLNSLFSNHLFVHNICFYGSEKGKTGMVKLQQTIQTWHGGMEGMTF